MAFASNGHRLHSLGIADGPVEVVGVTASSLKKVVKLMDVKATLESFDILSEPQPTAVLSSGVRAPIELSGDVQVPLEATETLLREARERYEEQAGSLLNADYLRDAMDSKFVDVNVYDALDPAYIRIDDGQAEAIIMPVRR